MGSEIRFFFIALILLACAILLVFMYCRLVVRSQEQQEADSLLRGAEKWNTP